MTFQELGVIEPILKALKAEGYTHPTPIQEQSIPVLLKGKDLLGCAQTGTGKTAAFAIPIIQRLYESNKQQTGKRKIKVLVVTPTRELAIQIADSFTNYAKFTGLKNTVIFGGVKQGSQTNALSRGIDILVATPGRLLDLINQGYISLNDIEYSVLDEADQMLDMGFIHDIKKIIALLPSKRQSLFFSATMPPDIVALSQKILGNPEKITIKPEKPTAERVDQAVYFVSKKNKIKLLIHLFQTEDIASVLVFSRTKHGANKIVKLLDKAGIKAGAIHGNKSQAARQKALSEFKDGELAVLVATDIAARGIDVAGLPFVVNYDLPNIPETYVHRIGRTGRASASGVALSFCSGEEKPYLKDIEKLIKQKVAIMEEHPYVLSREEEIQEKLAEEEKPKQQGGRRRTPSKGGSGNSSPSSRGKSNKNRGPRGPRSRG